MNARTTLLRRLSLSSPDRLTASLREICTIVAALERRDAEAAFLATVEHVERAAAAIVALDGTGRTGRSCTSRPARGRSPLPLGAALLHGCSAAA